MPLPLGWSVMTLSSICAFVRLATVEADPNRLNEIASSLLSASSAAESIVLLETVASAIVPLRLKTSTPPP
jgi:hypothetical protein